MKLSKSQIRYLRGLCHNLNPVVMVADKGLTENVMAEIELALEHHELIKIKLRGDKEQRQQWQHSIDKSCKAETVQSIGQVTCLYRKNKDKPKVALPD